MRSRLPRITVTLVLLICFVCPFVEMFDRWDHTIQTGNDTEYSLVVLALCIGFGYSAARFLFGASLRSGGSARAVSKSAELESLAFVFRRVIQLASSISPPRVALRI